MKRTILFASVLFFLIISFGCSSDKKNKDDELMKKIAKLSIQYEKIYSYDNFIGELPDEDSKFLLILKKYDNGGRVVTEEIFDRNELEDFVISYKYDDKNNVIEEIYYDEFNNLLGSVKNEYKNGLIIKTISYLDSGESWYAIDYKHNKDGNIIEENHYYGDSFAGKVLYDYNEFGEEMEFKQYDEDGNIEKRYEMTERTNDKKVYHWFNYDDDLERINIKIFNDDNILIEEEDINYGDHESLSFITKNIYKYDINGLLAEVITYNNDEPISCEKTVWEKF